MRGPTERVKVGIPLIYFVFSFNFTRNMKIRSNFFMPLCNALINASMNAPQNDQTYIKNLALFAVKFVTSVQPFCEAFTVIGVHSIRVIKRFKTLQFLSYYKKTWKHFGFNFSHSINISFESKVICYLLFVNTREKTEQLECCLCEIICFTVSYDKREKIWIYC